MHSRYQGDINLVAEFLLTKIITQFPEQFIDNKVNKMTYLSRLVAIIYPAHRIQFIYYGAIFNL